MEMQRYDIYIYIYIVNKDPEWIFVEDSDTWFGKTRNYKKEL